MKNSEFELGFAGRGLALFCFALAAVVAAGGLYLDHGFMKLLLPYMNSEDWGGDFTRVMFGFLFIMPFYIGAWKLVRLGLRLRSPDVASLLKSDSRAPVLYLRSYATEDQTDSRTGRRIEELTTANLRNLGPVIAIGRPGELLPKLGAARMSVKPEAWKSEAHRLMELSQLIVFQAGFTDGLLWELGEASKLAEAKPILICAPVPREGSVTNKQQQYERFLRALANSFPAAAALLPAELANTGYFLIDKPGHLVEFTVTDSLRPPTVLERVLSDFGVGKSLPVGILDTLRPGLGAEAESKMKKRKIIASAAIAAMYAIFYIYVNMTA